MTILAILFLGIFSFAQCNGDLLSNYGIDEEFKNVLLHKIGDLIDVKLEVENILKDVEKKENERSTNHANLLQNSETQSCLRLLANEPTGPPCPDFKALVAQMRSVIVDLTQIIIDGIDSFNEAFNNSSNQCTATRNPFTALRCFLRAFREAYNNLSKLQGEVSKMRDDALKLYDQYLLYSKNCKPDPQEQKNLISLCQKLQELTSS